MIRDWLEARREGREQRPAEIGAFVHGLLDGSVTRAQAAAWLAFVAVRGMTPAETVALTRAMADSGTRQRWEGITGPFWDKHSTGGVGDKVSLVLAPAWAAMGRPVPMVSGRGLGITGGTLDKLESIEGFRTALDATELRRVLREAGCFIAGATAEVAPADRVLYALRDETATVPSIPLITASILSKKIAAGVDRLVLDVKCGTGAFMTTPEAARALADSLVLVGRDAGLDARAFVTPMSEPLGTAVGNALEVREAIECLEGRGPADLRELVLLLSLDREGAARALDSGAAREAFARMVRAQGGDLDRPLRGGDAEEEVVPSDRTGVVRACDAALVGGAAFVLGAGRTREGEAVHPGVGVRLRARVGDRVAAGAPLADLLHAGRDVAEARALVRSAFRIEG